MLLRLQFVASRQAQISDNRRPSGRNQGARPDELSALSRAELGRQRAWHLEPCLLQLTF